MIGTILGHYRIVEIMRLLAALGGLAVGLGLSVGGLVHRFRVWRVAVVSPSLAVCAILAILPLHAQKERTVKDVVYATVGGKNLSLDLYMPAGVAEPALVVWVHGGAWRSGSKARPPMAFVENGFAMASLDFRQSGEARFPTNVHDIKAAIRFLRGKASEYGYRVDRIAIAGSSSGAHLAALVGVTNGHKELEGDRGWLLEPVIRRGRNPRLLRGVEPHDDPGAVDALWRQHAPARARAVAWHDARPGPSGRHVASDGPDVATPSVGTRMIATHHLGPMTWI
jgi:hypothetical protein